ncbi:MAG: hypothetical protein K8J31_21220 [Anaerolineae bacterium]|nr:hypothetical protein [Anaerolineae bacterium]
MLVLIKTFHTAVFVFMCGCILYIWIAGLNRIYDWTLALALGAIVLEGVVWWSFGRKCPLTDLARKYGDVSGNDWLADMFLPRWASDKIVPVSSLFVVIGLVILLVNYPR